LAIFVVVLAVNAPAQPPAPIKLVEAFQLPADVAGHFDHFGVDLKGRRLFATPEDYKAVLVLDLSNGKLIGKINGIGRPHAVFYRADLDRIYVTDGNDGDLKIFDVKTHRLLKSVKLLADADSMGYDPATKYLYIDNGGGDAHQTYSILSVVDTTAGTKVADIKIDGETLEAMALETSSPRLYVNNRRKNRVDVIDRDKRTLIASWPVTLAKDNVAMALDEARHRLFVGCRSGQIVIIDTATGKELQALAITKGVDDMAYDPARGRLYAACDGAIDIEERTGAGDYKFVATVPSGPLGRTARLVPELNRYFVAVPQQGSQNAQVLVYEVH